MEQQALFPLCVHLILQREDKILLLERKNTKLFDGYWCLPTGKVESGETPMQAISRESYEELGIRVEPKLITTIAVKQPDYYDPSSTWNDISFFFLTNYYHNELYNKEPNKHAKLEFFNREFLPSNIIPVVKYGIEQFYNNIYYSEFIESDVT